MARPHQICVFGSSSPRTLQKHLDVAETLGKLIADNGCVCVNGGGKFGVMGALNKGCREEKGEIIGVIHEKFVFDTEEDEFIKKMIVCKGNDLNERKQLLFDYGDCIIVAPGGVGTFDEMWDCICGRSLQMKGLVNKPICILNVDGFYDGSVQQLQRAYQDNLLYHIPETYFHVENTPEAALQWCLQQLNRPDAVKAEEPLSEHRLKTREKLDMTKEYVFFDFHPQHPALLFVVGLALGVVGTLVSGRYLRVRF